MTDIIPIANFRARLEAEVAARLLEGAAVPYVINSPEGMFHGPLGAGATILVRADDVDLARDALAGELPRTPPRVVRVATCPTAEAADRVRGALNAVGIVRDLKVAKVRQPLALRRGSLIRRGR